MSRAPSNSSARRRTCVRTIRLMPDTANAQLQLADVANSARRRIIARSIQFPRLGGFSRVAMRRNPISSICQRATVEFGSLRRDQEGVAGALPRALASLLTVRKALILRTVDLQARGNRP
jgi:hypothetical protein